MDHSMLPVLWSMQIAWSMCAVYAACAREQALAAWIFLLRPLLQLCKGSTPTLSSVRRIVLQTSTHSGQHRVFPDARGSILLRWRAVTHLLLPPLQHLVHLIHQQHRQSRRPAAAGSVEVVPQCCCRCHGAHPRARQCLQQCHRSVVRQPPSWVQRTNIGSAGSDLCKTAAQPRRKCLCVCQHSGSAGMGTLVSCEAVFPA